MSARMIAVIMAAAALVALKGCGGGQAGMDEVDGRNDLSSVFGNVTSYNNAYGGPMAVRPARQGPAIEGVNSAEYWTSADGCTYSRAQAPGEPPKWYLVLNPYHIGKPNAHPGCAIMVGEKSS